ASLGWEAGVALHSVCIVFFNAAPPPELYTLSLHDALPISLDTLPFGASRYPEWGSAGVVGGSRYAAQAPGMPGALPASLLAALLTASISGWSMVVLRRLIASHLERIRDRLEDGSLDALLSLHLSGMSLDLLRGGLVTVTAMLIFAPLVKAIVAVWGSESAASHAVVVIIAAFVAGSSLWTTLH